jgi:membrane-associated phospholipid phosphatase
MPRRPGSTFALYSLPFVGLLPAYALLGRFGHARPVHVREPHELESWLFPVPTSSGFRTLSDLIAAHHSAPLDLLCGAVYFAFLFEVLAAAVYLFFRARPLMLELALRFGAVNLLGWSTWLLYPTAPPWYVDAHGLTAPSGPVASNAAALTRVDALLGTSYFEHFYAGSAYVFGAFPSLHVSYAVLVALVTWQLGGWLRVAAPAFAVSIAFAAVYLRHHYLIDVLGGTALAVVVAPWWRVVRPRTARVEVMT